MSYPLAWLTETFSSTSRAQSLLRPDLESGLISQHDFDLATTFLPGYHRYWPYAYGFAGSFLPTVLARARARPLGAGRTFIVSVVGYLAGSIVGEIQRAAAHMQFNRSIENPRGFAQALQNVNLRTGGTKPLPWTLPTLKDTPRPTENSQDIHGDTARPDESESAWAPDIPQQPPSLSLPTSSDAAPPAQSSAANTRKPPSKWDNIRSANAAGAKQSSWDVLRQNHERAAVNNATNPADDATEFTPREPDRAEEQARFDALLEAERKLAGRA